MPSTSFASNDPLTKKKWGKDIFKYAIALMMFSTANGLLTSNGNGVVHVNAELSKQRGDGITFQLIPALMGTGQGDDGTLIGNEEAMTAYNFLLNIHERGHAVRSAGKMSEQRAVMKFRPTAKQKLAEWLSNVALEDDIWRALCGLRNASTALSTVNYKYPSSNRIMYIGQTAAGTELADKATDALLSAQTATDALFGTTVIERARRKAMVVTPKIQPLRIEGEDVYVMYIHPYQSKALRKDTAWLEAQQHANLRGSKNPLFTAALGRWENVIILESQRIPVRTGAGGTAVTEGFLLNDGQTATTDAVATGKSVARAVLCGKQAIALGWGQMPEYGEDWGDVAGLQRQAISAVDMIYG
ncbi:MAG: N4-gp56 family major capsid protein, partial [Phycisphaerae bacterium]|nr:N4-gp56 family major capsid protein [Phycisphaerae bacterium]